METEEIDIAIADCAQAFIDDAARSEYLGWSSSVMSEIQDYGITSPPEQLWYAAAIAYGFRPYAGIFPQYKIGSYRVDFMVSCSDYFVNQCFPAYPDAILTQLVSMAPCYVIEIDGFEWHDKTPEQAENDKRRERHITQEGYRVLRYAAREVLRDPRGCVGDVYSLCQTDLKSISSRIRISLA